MTNILMSNLLTYIDKGTMGTNNIEDAITMNTTLSGGGKNAYHYEIKHHDKKKTGGGNKNALMGAMKKKEDSDSD